MAGADVGGDGSVKWRVWVGNVRHSELKHNPKGPNGHEQGGVDETDRGEEFTVTIKVPRDDAKFLTRLGSAVGRASKKKGSRRVTFTLPIRQGDDDQIQIRWNSKPVRKRKGKPRPKV